MLYEIDTSAKALLDKRIRLIKRGWLIYTPFAMLAIYVAVAARYDEAKPYEQIILATLGVGVLYTFAFILSPLKRVRVLNKIVNVLFLEENKLTIVTYPVLWRRSKVIALEYTGLELKAGANDEGTGLLGQHPSYRFIEKSTNNEFFLAPPFFPEWAAVEEILKEKELYEELSSN